MLKTEAIIIRPGTVSDTVAINRIYNHFILHTTVTFDIKPWDDDKRRQWIRGFTCPHFLLVAEYDGAVIGFCCNHQLRPKAAYDLSTEVTIYTAPSGVPTGTGTLLYKALFVRLIATPLHRAYAIIALPNNASVTLHERFGFTRVGLLQEVGHKFGQWVDVAWYEMSLSPDG